MDFKEFQEIITKKRTKKKAKVSNSWGVYDVYKHIRKNGWYNIGRPLKEHEFYSIIRGINLLLAEEILKGNSVKFFHRMGHLDLRKKEHGVYLKDGKLVNTYPVNWNDTIKLWYEDEEARKNKTLIRLNSKYVYHVQYSKYRACYKNRRFYEFALNRFIKQKLKENIISGKTDTVW